MKSIRAWFQMGHVSVWTANNLNWRQLRGNNVEILPFFRVFLPWPDSHRYDRNITIHFGWIIWTVGIHFYFNRVFRRGKLGKSIQSSGRVQP